MVKFIVKAIVGLSIFGLMIWKIGPSMIYENLKNFSLVALLLINITTVAGYFIAGTSVTLLGRTINGKLGWLTGIKGVLSTISLSLFLPGRAGDLSLPFFWRDHMASGQCLAIVILDKFITIVWVVLFAAAGIYFIMGPKTAFIVAGAGFFIMSALFFTLSVQRFRDFIVSFIPEKIMGFLLGGMNAFRTFRNDGKKALLKAFFLAGVRIFINGMGFWISLIGAGISPPFFYSVCLTAAAMLAALVPISILGIGSADAIFVLGMTQIGFTATPVMSALIAGRLTTIFCLTVFFLWLDFKKPDKMPSNNKN